MKNNAHLYRQIDSFVDQLETYNTKLPVQRKRQNKDYSYLRKFYKAFIDDRNKRADSIESKNYAKTLALVKKEFPMMTLWVLCMDGRVKSIHTNGATAGIGSSIRVPGGILKEFVRGNNGKLSLIPHSHFATLLDTMFVKHDVITEVFDSHIGCAARAGEEAARGNAPEDAGLFSDVLHKKEMAQATQAYVLSQYDNKKSISIIQTSFDPHNGYMFMGLETDKALIYVTKHHNQQFTVDALKDLVNKKLILSTKQIVQNEKIKRLFNQHFFAIDWKDAYIQSAYTFWSNIDQMKDTTLPIIEVQLLDIFSDLNKKTDFAKKCLRERAMLVLTNAYNAYLHHTTDPHSQLDQKNIHTLHQYRYGQHEEEGIKVS